MPALIHKMPDKDNVVLRAVAQQIQRKRKVIIFLIQYDPNWPKISNEILQLYI